MKYLKMLGLAALAAGALMAFVGAGTASATELTCTNPPGTKVMCPAGTEIYAHVEEGSKVVLDPIIGSIECSESTVRGFASTGGGSSTETPNGEITELTFGTCNAKVEVLKRGTLEVHTKLNEKGEQVPNDGTVTSNGAEVTVEFSGFHCIFTTKNTDIGTLTGSTTTKGMPTFDIEATISRTGGRSGAFCGNTAAWTGHYTITTPEWMDVD